MLKISEKSTSRVIPRHTPPMPNPNNEKLNSKRMYAFITLTRAFAIILIFSANLINIFPFQFSERLGIALYFSVTGFMFWEPKKVQKGISPFWEWYHKELLRLYIPLTIVNLVTVIMGYQKPSVLLFLFPISSELWFIPAILILLALFYLFITTIANYRLQTLAIVGFVYTALYVFHSDKSTLFVNSSFMVLLSFGFAAMLIGTYIKSYWRWKIVSHKDWRAIGFGILGFLGILLVMCINVAFCVNPKLMPIQWLPQLIELASAGCFLMCAYHCECRCYKIYRSKFGTFLNIVNSLFIEIYLVQFAVIYYVLSSPLPIWADLLLALPLTAVSSAVIHYVSGLCSTCLIPFIAKSRGKKKRKRKRKKQTGQNTKKQPQKHHAAYSETNTVRP